MGRWVNTVLIGSFTHFFLRPSTGYLNLNCFNTRNIELISSKSLLTIEPYCLSILCFRDLKDKRKEMTNVTLITGDGIGPQIAQAARRCVDATGAPINWEIAEAGVDVMAKKGTPLPQ
jgi:hypothetical protein